MDWNTLYEEPIYRLKEPAQEVIDFVPLLKKNNSKKVLDLGYGAGRHIIYLAKEGFDVFGTDISLTGEDYTKQWLSSENLKAELKYSDMTFIPYADNFFDGIISRGVITHNTKENILKSISEMKRTLKPGGLVMITFISTESSLYGSGKLYEENTFICDDGIEKGVLHHFCTKSEVEEMMQDFEQIELVHYKHKGVINIDESYVSAHWVFVGKKANNC